MNATFLIFFMIQDSRVQTEEIKDDLSTITEVTDINLTVFQRNVQDLKQYL